MSKNIQSWFKKNSENNFLKINSIVLINPRFTITELLETFKNILMHFLRKNLLKLKKIRISL